MNTIEMIEENNRALKQSLATFHLTQNKDTFRKVVEGLVHSTFLMPGTQVNADVTLSIALNPEKKPFFLAFTDREELRKWKKTEEYLVIPFRQMIEAVVTNPKIAGVVINAKGNNFILPAKQAGIIAQQFQVADQMKIK